jgi:nucleoside-diphosphate-sugar epimerase
MARITIMGAGWLGLPLGKRLAALGHVVSGTTTREDRLATLAEAGITPQLLGLTPEPTNPALLRQLVDTDTLVIAFPPGRSNPDVINHHRAQVDAIIVACTSPRPLHVYHVSTTGVYGGGTREIVTEDVPLAPIRPSAIAVANAEDQLRAAFGDRLTIARCAGLIGWGRHGVRHMAGKTDIPGGDDPVNLISGEDAVHALTLLIDAGITGETFNLCCDEHPTRQDFYTGEAHKLSLPTPTFLPGLSSEAKIVSAEKIKRRLSLTWHHPAPGDVVVG